MNQILMSLIHLSVYHPPEYWIATMGIPGQENGLDLRQLRRAVRQSVSTYAQVQPLQVGSIEVSVHAS